MYYHRKIENKIKQALKQFPAIVITGARQSGKSTLLKQTFPDFTYFSLDDPQIQLLARQDPRLFLASNPRPMIIDEIQYVPELLNYIKIEIDQNRQDYGQFLITGSQMFNLMSGVAESLAGRVAVFHLYPFNLDEISAAEPFNAFDDMYLAKQLIKGFYPETVVRADLDLQLWFASYIATYIERDIRNIRNVSDLGAFNTFIHLLANRAGAILNISEVAKETGISVPTAKSWISLLESTYIIYLLRPYHTNLNKRLIKSPKIYFLDTGLLCYYLGIDSTDRLLKAAERGHIFENFILMELIKRFFANGIPAPISFYRTMNGVEVDLIINNRKQKMAIEIKFSKTPNYKMASGLRKFKSEIDDSVGYLMSLHDQPVLFGPNIHSIHWSKCLQEIERVYLFD